MSIPLIVAAVGLVLAVVSLLWERVDKVGGPIVGALGGLAMVAGLLAEVFLRTGQPDAVVADIGDHYDVDVVSSPADDLFGDVYEPGDWQIEGSWFRCYSEPPENDVTLHCLGRSGRYEPVEDRDWFTEAQPPETDPGTDPETEVNETVR